MKKIILATCCVLMSWNVNALELADVQLPDTVKLGDATLQLNGAGIRTKWFFKIYVGALYLTHKETSDDAIIADEHEHRVAIHMLHELGSKRLFNAFEEGIEANNSHDELAALDAQIRQMKQVFDSVNEVKPGDVITLDYVPASGTRISVNGIERGVIAGAAFNRALLKIWLGKHPVQDDLKKGMLGG